MFKPVVFVALLITPLWAMPANAEVERVERGNLILENIPEIPASITDRIEQYQNTRAAGLADWMPDGSILIGTRFGDTTQIHRVRQPMGAREQLTFFAEPVSNARVSPDRRLDGFLYSRDAGGDEFHQLYWFDLAAGEHRLVTDGGRTRNQAVRWSNRGDRFAYSSTRRDGRNYDIYVAVAGQSADAHRLVLEGRGAWMPVDWSPDDRRLLVANYVSINESTLHVVDVETGERTQVNPQDDRIGYGAAAFDRTGHGIYVVHDHGTEFRHLYHHDLPSGRMTPMSADIQWDVSAIALSPNRERMAFVTNEGGRSMLYLRDLRRNRALAAPRLPTGLIGGLNFSPDGNRLGLTLNTTRTPSDVYVFDFGRRSLTRWTQSEVGGLDASRFPDAELVSFESFDGLEVPAWVYRPQGEGPHPVIVQIHGGPESQSRPSFSSLFAYWVNELGAAVVSPNVRGSTGYGRTYVDLDNWRLREDSVRDIGALLDWISTQPDLDQERVIVYGGSYGGYMVLASLVHYNDRLLGGVNIVGISNFVTFLQNTESYRRDLRRAEYGDERDPEMRAFLERISPLNNIERVTRPMFVAHGANDPRVPLSEATQVVEAVRANGGEVWYLVATDEGHGFAKKVNRDYFQAASALFMKRLFAGELE